MIGLIWEDPVRRTRRGFHVYISDFPSFQGKFPFCTAQSRSYFNVAPCRFREFYRVSGLPSSCGQGLFTSCSLHQGRIGINHLSALSNCSITVALVTVFGKGGLGPWKFRSALIAIMTCASIPSESQFQDLMGSYRVPESETPLDLLCWQFHTSKVLFHECQRILLRLSYSVRLDISFGDGVAKVKCSRVKIRFREDTETCVDLTLKWETCDRSVLTRANII